MKNKKVLKIVIGVAAIVAAVAVLVTVYYVFREKPENPNMGLSENGTVTLYGKDVVIEVTDSAGENTRYEITTHADYLQGVMDEAEGLEYETSDGMVMTVNGERADYVKDGAYWAFYVNDEYCNYGIADQPVNDGDKFKIEYTKA